jgi:hypothetical protein
MKKAYGYCRASTGKQELTFDVQRAAIERYYDSRLKPEGYEWGGFFEDKATSGGKPFTEREQGMRLWVTAQPDDAIIWYKMDRAFRSVRDGANCLDMLRAKRIAVHSIDIGLDTGTALGDFVCKLLMLLGELERSWVSTRTRDAMEIKRQQGLPINGAAPAGWKAWGTKKTRHLVADEDEKKLLESIYTEWMAGGNIEGISNRLHFTSVKRYGGQEYGVQWLLYAMHARALGYPKWYDRMKHNDHMKWLKDNGGKKGGHKGATERVRLLEEGDPKVALPQHLGVCPSVT